MTACGESKPADHESGATATVVTAPTPEVHRRGEVLYGEHCARCHGERAGGSTQGPPLVHPTYKPSHHADFAFYRAVAFGVRAHHWRFGDMPPVPAVAREEVRQVVGYVRWLQRAAGIH